MYSKMSLAEKEAYVGKLVRRFRGASKIDNIAYRIAYVTMGEVDVELEVIVDEEKGAEAEGAPGAAAGDGKGGEAVGTPGPATAVDATLEAEDLDDDDGGGQEGTSSKKGKGKKGNSKKNKGKKGRR